MQRYRVYVASTGCPKTEELWASEEQVRQLTDSIGTDWVLVADLLINRRLVVAIDPPPPPKGREAPRR